MAFSSYWIDDPSDISHYGVKGMKCGCSQKAQNGAKS